MSDKIYDPSIHQDSEHLIGFRFRHTNLMQRIEDYRKTQPEGADLTCGAIASRVGLAESTLKKLKAGQISDPRGSTYWLLWKAFNIDPRELLGIPIGAADVNESEMRVRLDEKRERIVELTREVETLQAEKLRLQRMYNEACKESAAAIAEIKHLEIMKTTLYNERYERKTEQAEYKRLRVALIVMCAVAILALGASVYMLWDVMNPGMGFFR